jgi:hypothetical protein
MPLSGAAMISWKTDAASPNRCAGSLSIASNDVVRAKPATIANFISFASSVAGIRCNRLTSALLAPSSGVRRRPTQGSVQAKGLVREPSGVDSAIRATAMVRKSRQGAGSVRGVQGLHAKILEPRSGARVCVVRELIPSPPGLAPEEWWQKLWRSRTSRAGRVQNDGAAF